jgi:hypothetical protein
MRTKLQKETVAQCLQEQIAHKKEKSNALAAENLEFYREEFLR